MRKSLIYNWWLSGGGDTFPEDLKSLFSVLWLGQISGSTMVDESGNANDITITGKDFVTSYIPPTSAATFALANSAPLKVDDNFDGAWYTDAGAVRQVPVSYFINNDYSRTLVKYSNSSPYNVEWIGLLDDAATPTSDQWDELHELFQLPVFWSGVLNAYGVVKENRSLEGQGYKGWIAQIQALALTEPSTTVKASVNKLALDLRNYGVDIGYDRFWPFMLNDSALVSGAGTVSLFKPGSTRFSFPVAPTYTASGFEANGTTQYGLANYNPTTDGVQYTLNSASRGLYQYKARTMATSYTDGCISSAVDVITNSASSSLQRINGSSFGSALSLNSVEYIAVNRSGASAMEVYQGVTRSTSTAASSGLANQSFTVLRAQFGWGDSGVGVYYIGRSFTQTEHGNIRTAILAHKTRLGL